MHADFERVFGRVAGADAALEHKQPGQVGRFHPAQFAGLQTVPFECSPALNLIGVQPPGDPFWTEVTLARAQARYPGWDLGPWRAASGSR